MTSALQRRALEIAFDAGISVSSILDLARTSAVKITMTKTAGALVLRARKIKELA
jgi:hypothetical protein